MRFKNSIRVGVLGITIAAALLVAGCRESKVISARLSSSNPGGGGTCNSASSGGLRVRDGSGPSASTIENLVFTDTLFSPTYRVAEVDGCGGFIADVSAATWTVSGAGVVVLPSNSTGSAAALRLLGGAPSGTQQAEVNVSATASGGRTLSGRLRVTVISSALLRKIPGLVRWYLADQYDAVAVGTPVAVSGSSAWQDWGSSVNAYDGIAMASGREPLVDKDAFSTGSGASRVERSGLKFCGKSAGCTYGGGPVTTSAAVRFAPSYAEFAGSDLTLFALVRRQTTARTFVVSNQSSGNQSGLFMGYTSNTLFEFSLRGPGGVPALSSVIGGYAAPGVVELWTGRVDTQPGSSNPGMQLYRNGVLVASNPGITAGMATATTIPLLGTYRSENDAGLFSLGEYIQFGRGLSDPELCSVHRYLSQKFDLGLNLGC